jgi:hypothetical protein
MFLGYDGLRENYLPGFCTTISFVALRLSFCSLLSNSVAVYSERRVAFFGGSVRYSAYLRFDVLQFLKDQQKRKMPKQRLFNQELRGFILQHAIRQEGLTSEILKSIFRILKSKTKTLDNKSSSLSFKNKIDLLHDLGDITDEDNKHFTKLLEIRNQFAHNPKCISFVALDEENPEYTKHLLKNFSDNETDIEKKLLTGYISLFKYCHRILCEIKKSYYRGFLIELERYQCYELLHNRFTDWITQARENHEQTWSQHKLEESVFKSLKLTLFIATLDAYKHKLFSEISYEVATNSKMHYEIFKKKLNNSEWEIWLNAGM